MPEHDDLDSLDADALRELIQRDRDAAQRADKKATADRSAAAKLRDADDRIAEAEAKAKAAEARASRLDRQLAAHRTVEKVLPAARDARVQLERRMLDEGIDADDVTDDTIASVRASVEALSAARRKPDAAGPPAPDFRARGEALSGRPAPAVVDPTDYAERGRQAAGRQASQPAPKDARERGAQAAKRGRSNAPADAPEAVEDEEDALLGGDVMQLRERLGATLRERDDMVEALQAERSLRLELEERAADAEYRLTGERDAARKAHADALTQNRRDRLDDIVCRLGCTNEQQRAAYFALLEQRGQLPLSGPLTDVVLRRLAKDLRSIDVNVFSGQRSGDPPPSVTGDRLSITTDWHARGAAVAGRGRARAGAARVVRKSSHGKKAKR